MQYVLFLHQDGSRYTKMNPAEQQQGLAAYQAFHEALTKANVLTASGRLQPATASTTVRINVPDLDAAITWAARCPGAQHGVVEIRPLWDMAD